MTSTGTRMASGWHAPARKSYGDPVTSRSAAKPVFPILAGREAALLRFIVGDLRNSHLAIGPTRRFCDDAAAGNAVIGGHLQGRSFDGTYPEDEERTVHGNRDQSSVTQEAGPSSGLSRRRRAAATVRYAGSGDFFRSHPVSRYPEQRPTVSMKPAVEQLRLAAPISNPDR